MHYINVKLLNGFSGLFTYKVPENCQANLVGSVVKVPLKDRLASAYVISQTDQKPSVSFAIKEMHSLEPFPADAFYRQFLAQLAYYYQVEPLHFVKRIRQFVSQEADQEIISTKEAMQDAHTITLTPEQTQIVQTLKPAIGSGQFTPALLHGVTGSGKTEVYKQLITATIAQGKTALLLLPEVSLALRFEQILKQQLASIPIFGFHSGTKAKEKKLLWQMLLQDTPALIIGVHIPILLPIANVGLIIVDEEHEIGYQEKKHPKVNSKEAALLRAQLCKIPILLGSATPSIASLHTAKTKNWYFFSLHKRFAGAFPEIKTVLLTNKERRANFWITKELEQAIGDRLAKKEQVIIFLNRRGYSFFVQCKDCSFIFECTACSVSLTLHNNNLLTCHYCGRCQELASACPKCKASNSLLKKGIGTQQVVTILENLFPHARIGRADMDVSSKKKVWQQTMHDFENGTIDILVGTQTITKGFHFPNVTLVGILWADLNLHFPVYNAAETSLQQLIQVAGRAGRTRAGASVIVQTMMKHPIFNFLNETDYLQFYDYEYKNRASVGYPPLLRLVEIELKNTNENLVEQESFALAQLCMKIIDNKKYEITLLGPAKPPIAKIKNTHARKIYLKSSSIKLIIELYRSIDKTGFRSQIFFTPNPN